MLSAATAEQIAAAIELPDWVLETSAAWTYACVGSLGDSFEAVVKVRFPEPHAYVQKWMRNHQHPFASRLPYLNPWHVIASILGYFAMIVLFRVFGRFLGKFSCRTMGLVHNLGLHFLSLYMSVGLLVSARAAGYSLWNNAAGTSRAEWRVAKLIWLFYVSKVVEWVDTLIMLLKQNYHQVSFLHVYHHATIFAMWWLASLAAPGGEAYYSAMVNSGIHVVMYGYYFLTLLFPTGTVRNVLNKFKFVITKGQMTQFTFNCVQSAYDLVWVPRAQLKYSAPLLQALFWYMITLLALFGNFLAKNSKKTHRHRHHAHQTAEQLSEPSAKEAPVDNATSGSSGMKTGMTKTQANKQEKLNNHKNFTNGKSIAQTHAIQPVGGKPMNATPVFRSKAPK
jgi:elongation of very long chain fatty acids protein 4